MHPISGIQDAQRPVTRTATLEPFNNNFKQEE